MKKAKVKFQFNIEFQEHILRYTLTDKDGYKAISLYQPEYFETNEHFFIAALIKDYFKTKKRIPHNVALVIELAKKRLKNKKYSSLIPPKEANSVLDTLKKLYKEPVQNGNDILEECVNFARYVELRNLLEVVDIEDFSAYDTFSKQVKKAIAIGSEHSEDKGTFLIEDIRSRQIARKNRDDIYELPFKQLNKLTNAHGYQSGSIMVVLDKPKAMKTTLLVNIAKSYAKRKKKVIVFDLENGEEQYAQRLEQSIMGLSKLDILQGEKDAAIQKVFRKYKRIGSEIVVKKLPAYTTTADTLRYWLDYYYNEYGLRFSHMVIDYIGKMGAISGVKDDTQRISDAYVDVDNLANEYGIVHTWTGHHVKREAYPRRNTKYRDDDTAKCIDINRHVSMMLGLQQDASEKEQNIARLEIISQRDGIDTGRVWFRVDPACQRFEELSKSEIEDLEAQRALDSDGDDSGPSQPRQRRTTTGDL